MLPELRSLRSLQYAINTSSNKQADLWQTKWDPENLHRHQDFAPVKREMPNHDLIQRQTLPPIKREFLSAGQDLHEDEFGSMPPAILG